MSRPAAVAHHVDLVPDSAYRTGHGNATGTMAILANPWHYPVEALCQCSQVVRCEALGEDWVHAGRMAGQAPAVAVLEAEPP